MYCRVCHKQKSEQHFLDFPDHSPKGPKRTLAQLAAQETAGADTGEESGGLWGLLVAGVLGAGILGLTILSAVRGAASLD